MNRRIVHLVLPLNNILLPVKLKHVNKKHEMFARKAKLITVSNRLSQFKEVEKKLETNLVIGPSQASAIDVTPYAW